MNLGINAVDDVKRGSSQVDKIYRGTNEVWVNEIIPNAPTAMSASDSTTGSVTIYFTNSSVGKPTPTYNLYENSTLVATDITNGYVRTVSGGTRSYFVRAINSAGHADSFPNNGTSYSVPAVPTNMSASDTTTGSVYIYYTNSSSGVPTPTYNLYENGGLVASDIHSGYRRYVSGGTRSYYVRAVNAAGYTNSSANNGTSYSVPSAPTGMSASDTTVGSVYIYFTGSSGVPTPTYSLYENSVLVASGISSGYRRYVSAGTRSYYVKAINAAGNTNSSANNGTSKDASGSQTFSSSGTFIGKYGYSQVNLCMTAGGGGGGYAPDQSGLWAGGGYRGNIYNGGNVNQTGGSSYTITIGGGGAKPTSYAGGTGGTSSAFGQSETGGAGGNLNAGFQGNNGTVTSCYGVYTNGAAIAINTVWYGGQASFANGGAINGDGSKGSGGGSSGVYGNGSGGAGYARITW